MKPTYIVDYAYGFDAVACGIDHVSELRTKKAIHVFHRYQNAYIVLAADLSDRTNGCGPLASMMRDYLQHHGIPKDRILYNPKGHNTVTETDAAHEIIRQQKSGRIVCVTSSFHALRVRLIWLYRYKKVVRVYRAYHPISWHERRLEFEKILRDLDISLFRSVKEK